MSRIVISHAVAYAGFEIFPLDIIAIINKVEGNRMMDQTEQ